MAIQDQKTDTATRELNSQALALAEQLGRIAGTLEGTAEAWLNRAAVTDQLTKVRDGATQLLNSRIVCLIIEISVYLQVDLLPIG